MAGKHYETGENYIARKIIGETALIPVGPDSFNGMITFNETGNFLWQKISEGCREEDLVSALCEEYDVTEEQASKDVALFLNFCLANKILQIKERDEH